MFVVPWEVLLSWLLTCLSKFCLVNSSEFKRAVVAASLIWELQGKQWYWWWYGHYITNCRKQLRIIFAKFIWIVYTRLAECTQNTNMHARTHTHITHTHHTHTHTSHMHKNGNYRGVSANFHCDSQTQVLCWRHCCFSLYIHLLLLLLFCFSWRGGRGEGTQSATTPCHKTPTHLGSSLLIPCTIAVRILLDWATNCSGSCKMNILVENSCTI